MKRSITRWTTAFAAAAFFGVPTSGSAQMTTPPPPASTSGPAMTPHDAATAAPMEHLVQAKAALAAIRPAAITGRARIQVAELKRHLASLERASAAKGTKAARPTATARTNANWGTEVAAMDKILTGLLGTTTTTGAGMPVPSGTTDAPPLRSKPAATITIDEATRTQLTEVRMHLTAFATAMTAATAKNPEPAPADPAVTQPLVMTTPPPMTTLPATTPSPEHPAETSPPAKTPSVASQAMPKNQDAARRELIAARDTLKQLTQLPAAAQLSGDARTQVTQLIANFNELITTESDWPASYAKVAANLTALLGPDDAAADATGGTPMGAVGTSGATTVALDPAVRAKLVEMRSQLNAFEKASGVTKK